MWGPEYEELRDRYIEARPHYEALVRLVAEAIREAAREQDLQCQVTGRTKSVRSFIRKALERDKGYSDPFNDITDKAGVRVVARYPWLLGDLETLVESRFRVLSHDNKRLSRDPDRFAYGATHFQVALTSVAANPLEGLQCEVQVLTRAESLWAETEHDLSYKSPTPLPDEIRRIFYRLVSMMELFDLEVCRANEEMGAMEKSPGEQLLYILGAYHRRFTDGEFSRDLSRLILDFFAERIVPDGVDVASRMEQFVSERMRSLTSLFDRYQNDSRANPLIWQPELFIILWQLERDSFVLWDRWGEILPMNLLESLAEDWAVPIPQTR